MTCAICRQPPLEGQPLAYQSVVQHRDPRDCVAATEAATALKCAAIAMERCRLLNGDATSQCKAGRPEMASITELKADQFVWMNHAIRRAYPMAFAQEEQLK